MGEIILFIISCVICCLGFYNLKKASKIEILKDIENDHTYNQNRKKIDELRNEIAYYGSERTKALNSYHSEKSKLQDLLAEEREDIKKQIELLRTQIKVEGDKYEQEIKMRIEECQTKKANYEVETEQAKTQLSKIKESISAGVKAQLREQEKIENLNFYKVKISAVDLNDIEKINQIKSILNKPTILNKLIWTSYYQKQTNELCNRVLGTNIKCGIYKITNLISQQSYVGQSVDIASRWKDHIKCGLGIDAPATNRLYNAMQQDGVHNFTFELLEECPRDQLNEKERLWIEIYQTDSLGYNSTKGNK